MARDRSPLAERLAKAAIEVAVHFALDLALDLGAHVSRKVYDEARTRWRRLRNGETGTASPPCPAWQADALVQAGRHAMKASVSRCFEIVARAHRRS